MPRPPPGCGRGVTEAGFEAGGGGRHVVAAKGCSAWADVAVVAGRQMVRPGCEC